MKLSITEKGARVSIDGADVTEALEELQLHLRRGRQGRLVMTLEVDQVELSLDSVCELAALIDQSGYHWASTGDGAQLIAHFVELADKHEMCDSHRAFFLRRFTDRDDARRMGWEGVIRALTFEQAQRALDELAQTGPGGKW